METKYTGAWSRQASDWYGDYDRFTVSGPTDPAHGDKSDAPPPLMMDAPTSEGGGEIFTDSVYENFEHLPPALRIDETPVQGQGTPEDAGHGYGGLTNLEATDAELGASRGRDLGAAKRATSTSPMYRFFNDFFYGFFTVGYEPPPITHRANDPVFIRGINSHPQNNGPQARPTAWSVEGDGWLRGSYESAVINRDYSPPNRRHGQVKMVETDIVTIIGDAPPPHESDTYASPFSSLQKFMPFRRRVRGIRRDPGPWDEDMLTIEPGVIAPVGADGMVAQ